MPRISVIVPVYNTEKYVEKCLDSIVNQTFQDIEIIVVNDGSTDHAEEKILKYPSIKYYKKENGGLSDARNYGVSKATGEYIAFVDSDDYLDINLFAELEPYMNQEIDLIKFQFQKVDENYQKLETNMGQAFDTVTGKEAFENLYCRDEFMAVAWLYLYKREFYLQNHFQFAKGLYHEDFGLIPIILLKARTVISTDIAGYYYFQNNNSITRNKDYEKTVKKANDLLVHYDNMLPQIKDLDEDSKEKIKIYFTNNILLRAKELNRKEQDHYIKEIKKRKLIHNLKISNIKQFIKILMLKINIKLYLKLKKV